MARDDDRTELEPASGGVPVGLVVGMVVGAALALFVAQNTDSTTVTWLVWDTRQPLWVVLLVTAAATLVAAELIGSARRRRKRKKG